MSRTLIDLAREKFESGSDLPFTELTEEMDDGDLCAMEMGAKNFLADSLGDEARAHMRRQLPLILAMLVVAIAAVVTAFTDYLLASATMTACGYLIMWKHGWKKTNDRRSADQMRRVVEWMTYENTVAKATIEGLKNLRDRGE